MTFMTSLAPVGFFTRLRMQSRPAFSNLSFRPAGRSALANTFSASFGSTPADLAAASTAAQL